MTHVEREEEVLDVLVEERLLDKLDRRLGRSNRLAEGANRDGHDKEGHGAFVGSAR